MSGVSVEAVRIAHLEAKNVQLKAELVRLKERMELLEKKLEEALDGRRTSAEALSISSSSSASSSAPLIHSSSPLLASPTLGSREVKADLKEVEQLLRHVAYGEQDKAEILIQKQPQLLLAKGNITDLSQREFKGISAFQYALWALDWHMWRMLLKYLPKEAAGMQFAELEEKGTAHGKHFSLAPLLEALNTYMKNYAEWCSQNMWGELESHWCRQVGGAQLLLPMHVVNEYCHPTRSFVPVPRFNEEALERSMKLYGDQGSFFTAVCNGRKLGETFGIVRCNMAAARLLGGYWVVANIYYVKEDAEAIQSLWKVRQQQLEALKAELIYFPAITPHLPPGLSEIVVSYLADEDSAISVPKM